MPIVSCSECNGKVSTSASSCPHCGHMKRSGSIQAPKPQVVPVQKSHVGIGKVILICIGVIFGIALIGSFLPEPSKYNVGKDPAQTKISETQRTTVEGVLTNEGGAEAGAGWVVYSLGYGRKALHEPKGDHQTWCKKHAGHSVRVIGELAGDCLLNWEPK